MAYENALSVGALERKDDGMALSSASPLRGLAMCAGAGGLELGLHIANPGYQTVCYIEREAYAASTLVARMDDETLDPAPIWDDLTTFDGRPWRGAVDIVSAGYPCQPFSQAGKRRGEKDPRHLWPHVRRVVVQCRPQLVFLENVPGHLSLGYPLVRRQLQALGYRVAEGIFSAEEVGASHRRDRLFILADADGNRQPWTSVRRPEGQADSNLCRHGAEMADAPRLRFKRRRSSECLDRAPDQARAFGKDTAAANPVRELAPGRSDIFPPGPADLHAWARFLTKRPETVPAVCRSSDGLASRVDRLRLCGNGVVPLAAAHAYRTLQDKLARF